MLNDVSVGAKTGCREDRSPLLRFECPAAGFTCCSPLRMEQLARDELDGAAARHGWPTWRAGRLAA